MPVEFVGPSHVLRLLHGPAWAPVPVCSSMITLLGEEWSCFRSGAVPTVVDERS